MPVVVLKRGETTWEIFVPDRSEDEARKWALAHANGTQAGTDSKIPSNGETAEDTQLRVLTSITGVHLGQPEHEDWIVAGVKEDDQFSNHPDRLAEAMEAENSGT